MLDQKVIVRFPPSPTGLLHMGSVRTALYNYLFARQNSGKFILRIEDTDKERSKLQYEDNIKDSMKWLGLNWDNDGAEWRQSERGEVYRKKIQELIKKGAAYVSQETEGENKEVVRFKNPGGKIKFQDLVRGEVEMDVGDLNDFIIAKNINEPIYHLAVVIDDLESGVTHVIRGEDGISNTPRQILILEALDGTRPIYAHLPLVLAPDKSKLSKRKHGESVSLQYYRDRGYEKDAILNFVALIGWNPGTDQEIFSLEELVSIFDLSKVQKKGGVFDLKKLRWVNKEHLKLKRDATNKKIEEKVGMHFGATVHPMLIESLFERIEVLSDIDELIEAGELDYFFKEPELDIEKIAWKGQTKEEAKSIMEKVLSIMEKSESYEKIKESIMQYAEEVGKGNLLWPLRYALSGKDKSPDPITLLDILGPEVSKQRIEMAIQLLADNS